MVQEFRRLASTIIDHIGSLGYHVEVYRDRQDDRWCEIVAVHVSSGERFRVEGDDVYLCACTLAQQVGIELEDG